MKIIIAYDYLNPACELQWYGAAHRSTSTSIVVRFSEVFNVYMKSSIKMCRTFRITYISFSPADNSTISRLPSTSRQPLPHTTSVSPSSTSSSSSHKHSKNPPVDKRYTSTAPSSSSSSTKPHTSPGSYSDNYPRPNITRQNGGESQDSMALSIGTAKSVGSSTASSRPPGVLKNPPKPIYVMRPGTFEIVLCVDNSEIKGG